MTELPSPRDQEVAAFDFRRPNLLSREHVRGIEMAHEMFTRRLSTRWSTRLRALVQVDPIGVDQARYDDYLRSMPNPNVLGTIGLPPLPGSALIELNSQLALLLVDRMLGGAGAGLSGSAEVTRRPTDLEDALVRDLIGQAADALSEALEPLSEGAEALGIDYNPQHVQLVAPSDMVVVLTYRVSVTQGVECEGMLSVCYPAPMLRPILQQIEDNVAGHPVSDGIDAETARRALAERFEDVPVELAVRLSESEIRAADVSRLRVGDVLRFDHLVSRPVEGRVGDCVVLDGHVGRRGRRVALQVTGWRAPAHQPTPIMAGVAAAAVASRQARPQAGQESHGDQHRGAPEDPGPHRSDHQPAISNRSSQ